MANFNDEKYWENSAVYNNFDVNSFGNQSQLDFQSFDQTTYNNAPVYGSQQYGQPNIFTPEPIDSIPAVNSYHTNDEFDEPPLLEELEIFPDRIIQKSLVVLNPFHAHGLANDAEYLFKETDLAGPITFCLALAACLFISGKDAHFGYIYGLSIISVIGMYILLTLMCNSMDNFVTISGVASILGYSILPILCLSVLGIFLSLNTFIGFIFASLSVILSTMKASKIFCLMTGDQNQRFLIAYPSFLVYVIFALLEVF